MALTDRQYYKAGLILLSFTRKILAYALIIFLLAACGPKPKLADKTIPFALKAEAKNQGALLYWRIDRPGAPIRGYDIYLADSQDGPGDLYNSTPYPGDTDGDASRESIELTGLINGKTYFVHITTVRGDGSLSAPSSRIEFRPLDKGRISISSNYLIDHSGYDFADRQSMIARHDGNDFYIYANGSKMGISSPSRMHSSLHRTRIKIEGRPDTQYDLTQPLSNGTSYMLELANGGRAKLTVIDIRDGNSSILATFDYIYYPPGIIP